MEVKPAIDKEEFILQDSDYVLWSVLKELVKAINDLNERLQLLWAKH